MVTVKQLAESLQVSPDAIYRWVAAGKIPSLRLPGGGLRFDEVAVRDSLASPQPEEAA